MSSVPWNDRLRHGASTCFVNSVLRFNTTELKYSWPKFLPRQIYHSYLQPLKDLIISKLIESEILESQANTFEKPGSLVHLPVEFLDDGGTPLFDSEIDKRTYLSSKYEISDLRTLGVKDLTPAAFIQKLEAVAESKVFRGRSDQWHGKLAYVLKRFLARSEFRGQNGINARIKRLPLIPIRGGAWLSGNDRNIFFDSTSDGTTVPSYIDVSIIDTTVAKDRDRRQLLEALGAKVLTTTDVCELILKLYGEGLPSRSKNAAIEHAVYLFKARNSVPQRVFDDLWKLKYCSTEPLARRGYDLYLDSPRLKKPVSTYFSDYPSNIAILHPDYLDADVSDKASWISWLTSSTGMSTFPRPTRDRRLTPEFLWLIKEKLDSEEVLLLLRDEWCTYFNVSAIKDSTGTTLEKLLQSGKVTCRDGSKVELKNTYLPLDDIVQQHQGHDVVPFLKTPEPKDHRWKVFKALGVGTEQDLRFNMSYLRMLAGSITVSLAELRNLYTKIQDQYSISSHKMREEAK